jgi:predicted SAM-dependent methyltransferase
MRLLRQILSKVGWAVFVIARRLKSRLLVVKRCFITPKLPKNPNGKVFIHLGCGDIASPEFINVDARPGPHVHYICDVTDLSIFADGYADLVYACHVLEHVRHNGLKKTLWEWRRILKPGGILRLSVPDFDKILHIYESCSREIPSICGPLMGHQDYEHNAHHSVFNHTYLCDSLREAGFMRIRQWEPDKVEHHDFSDWADAYLRVHGQAFPISLNLEAVK